MHETGDLAIHASQLEGGAIRPDGSTVILGLAATLLSVGVYLVGWPVFVTGAFPGNDSAMYALGGWLIHGGGVPYADFLDNKPPLVYLLNATGFVGDASPLRLLWALNAAVLAFALLVVGVVARRDASTRSVVGGMVVIALAIMPVLEGGNVTESYAMPLQGLILLCMSQPHDWKGWLSRSAIVGLAASGCFWLRPNLVAAGAAGLLVLMLSAATRRDRIVVATGFAAAVLTTSGVMLLWLIQKGVYADFVAAVFGFNRAYSNTNLQARLLAMVSGLGAGAGTSAVFAVAGVARCALVGSRNVASRFVTIFVLVWIALELPLAMVSGYRFPHYFIPIVYAASLPLLLGFDWMMALLKGELARVNGNLASVLVTPAVLAATLVGAGVPEIKRELKASVGPLAHGRQEASVASFLAEHSSASGRVLVWGYAPGPYVLAGRLPASRHVHTNFLTLGSFGSETMLHELLGDLRRVRPEVIVDALTGTVATLSPRVEVASDGNLLLREPPGIDSLRAWVQANYVMCSKVGPWQWPTYSLSKHGRGDGCR